MGSGIARSNFHGALEGGNCLVNLTIGGQGLRQHDDRLDRVRRWAESASRQGLLRRRFELRRPALPLVQQSRGQAGDGPLGSWARDSNGLTPGGDGIVVSAPAGSEFDRQVSMRHLAGRSDLNRLFVVREGFVGFPLQQQLIGQEIVSRGNHFAVGRIDRHGRSEMGDRFVGPAVLDAAFGEVIIAPAELYFRSKSTTGMRPERFGIAPIGGGLPARRQWPASARMIAAEATRRAALTATRQWAG